MEYVAIVTALALLEYMWIAIRVGTNRVKYNVEAPATTGDPIWERYYRVQQNTVEQLVIFLPALWVFAHFGSPVGAAALGVLFIAGRLVYALMYVQDPASRGVGFMMTFAANLLLVLGSLVQGVRALG
ncbi:MAG: MAPEG family protein [Deltaproteobacteria bacterium]|nr:MAPEG family protein [Deltaproteobacteria bacterium]